MEGAVGAGEGDVGGEGGGVAELEGRYGCDDGVCGVGAEGGEGDEGGEGAGAEGGQGWTWGEEDGKEWSGSDLSGCKCYLSRIKMGSKQLHTAGFTKML